METIVCWICHRRVPASLKNAHHARPQAAGGGPDDEVDLCSGCHHSLHRLQDMLGGRRASQAEDTAKAYYQDNPSAARRCLELAIKCLKWMNAKEDGRYKVAAHQDVEILVEVPLAVKNALMMLGREARDPKTNRRLGMAGAVRKILIEHVKRQFPQLVKEIEQSNLEAKKANPDLQYAKPRRRPVKTGTGELFDVETPE